MKSIILIILISIPCIGISQQINTDSIKLKQDELREKVAKEGTVTIIDTSGEVPVKKVIIKGERKNEMIMFKAESDVIHPADARIMPVKVQKWTMGMALGEIENGLIVEELKEGLAAEKAGINVGDLILFMDGKRIYTKEDFFTIWREFNKGETIKFKLKKGLFGRTVHVVYE